MSDREAAPESRRRRWRLYLYQQGSWIPDRQFRKRAAARRAGKARVRRVRSITSCKVEREA